MALLGAAVAVPLNVAVIVCVPTPSDEVVNDASPASTPTVANTVSPSVIVNVPLSPVCWGAAERNPTGPADATVTFAVNVTGSPNAERQVWRGR